jgi:hypothetical protein
LNIVQPAGGLFAVSGNKGDGGTTVEQINRCLHLREVDFDFLCDLGKDFLHANAARLNALGAIAPCSQRI